MKVFYVSSWGYWFLVRARGKREARREGVVEFGRSHVKTVREATPDEIRYYLSIRSSISEAE